MDENKYVRRERAVAVDIAAIFSSILYNPPITHVRRMNGRWTFCDFRRSHTHYVMRDSVAMSIHFVFSVFGYCFECVCFGLVCERDVRKIPFIVSKSIFFNVK